MDFHARFVGLVAYTQDPSSKQVMAFFINPTDLNITPHLPSLAIHSQYVAGGSSPADRSVAVGTDDILVWALDDCVIDILDPLHTPGQSGVEIGGKPIVDLGTFGLHLNRRYSEHPLDAPHVAAAVVMRSGTLEMSIEKVGSSETPKTANTGMLTVYGQADPVIRLTAKDGSVRRIELRQPNTASGKTPSSKTPSGKRPAAKTPIQPPSPTLWFSSMPTLAGQYEGPTLEIVAATGLVDWGASSGGSAVNRLTTAATVQAGVLAQFIILDDPELTRCGKPSIFIPASSAVARSRSKMP